MGNKKKLFLIDAYALVIAKNGSTVREGSYKAPNKVQCQWVLYECVHEPHPLDGI